MNTNGVPPATLSGITESDAHRSAPAMRCHGLRRRSRLAPWQGSAEARRPGLQRDRPAIQKIPNESKNIRPGRRVGERSSEIIGDPMHFDDSDNAKTARCRCEAAGRNARGVL
ncbi:hypothetical protein [Lysobacter sp. Hz 25]|uniref:hypothetical protein n=1 Tax=Lysobacter sp. Hz 25 TaxID=3383698 RepID=UPI0038D416BB